MSKAELKDPRVVRIFISSPFKGMEVERQLLSKFYWPKIEAELSLNGLNLRLVDMRWGISSSSMSASDTVNICLREISRSDIFVGMYGQRYGWHGLNDMEYQANLNRAAKKFPWVEKYRDRSVTELEYIHGHLNDPGAMAACFCFRDKHYDIVKIQENEGNLRRQNSYAAEDEEATKKLQELKLRVEKTGAKTIGIAFEYGIPEEAAEYIYNKVLEHLRNKIIAKMDNSPMDNFELKSLAHKAYQRRGIGMEVVHREYIDLVNEYLEKKTDKCYPLTLTGPMGCGKTSILCDWIERHANSKPKNSETLYFYHFIGAEPSSASPRNLMERIIGFVSENLDGHCDKSDQKLNLAKLVTKLRETLMKMQQPTHKYKQLVILVNNIENIQLEKSSMPLFWLPQNLPSNIKIILSLTLGMPGSDDRLQIMEEGYKIEKVEIKPYDREQKRKMVLKLLDNNSKLMEEEQLELIVSSPKTSNPMFLVTLISELCVSGRFNTLTDQIKDLLQCTGIQSLFMKVIKRIDTEYQANPAIYVGNAVEDVLCALCLCKQGIAESELPMSSDVWSPIIIALDRFIMDLGGILVFSFPEMKKAVQIIYTKSEEKKQAMAKKLSSIFQKQYERNVKVKNQKVSFRTATELLHLLRLSNDRDKFIKVLSDIHVFVSISKSSLFELYEHWQWLGTPSESIAQIYVESINKDISKDYASNWRSAGAEIRGEALERKSILMSYVREWFEECKMYNGVSYILQLEINIDSNRPGLTALQRDGLLCGLKYQKACFLSDTEKHEEALKLHSEVLESRRKLMEEKMSNLDEVGMSCNGVGLCYYNLKCLDEAERVFKMGLALGNSSECKAQQAAAYSNLGLICLDKKEYDLALDQFNKSMAIRKKLEPDILSLELAYGYHNLGLTYRNMKNYDMATNYYVKSLNVKETLLGRRSLDAAMSIMNLGTLECYRNNHGKSLAYAQEALGIFRDVAPEGSNYIMMAKENVVNQLTTLGRFKEAEPLFKEVRSGRRLPAMHRRFVQWYMKKNKTEEASDIAFELVKWTEFPGDFVMLNWADRKLPSAKKPKRPEWSTIDYAYNKWPRFPGLLSFKLASILENTPDQFESFVEQHCQQGSADETAQCYAGVAAVLKDELKDMKRVKEVLEIGVKKNPGNPKLAYALQSLEVE